MADKKIQITTYDLNSKQVKVLTSKKPNTLLRGVAGTAKTYTGLVRAVNLLNAVDEIERIVIVRSNVETRPMGFLPGTAEEKLEPFIAPYTHLFKQLSPKKPLKSLIGAKLVEVVPTTFLRGQTFDNAAILVDEFQNMTDAELETVLTRVGKGSQIILCGDTAQSDLRHDKNLHVGVVETFASMKSVAVFEFGVNDIVRSGFVKEYYLAKYRNEKDIPLPGSVLGRGIDAEGEGNE